MEKEVREGECALCGAHNKNGKGVYYEFKGFIVCPRCWSRVGKSEKELEYWLKRNEKKGEV